MDEYLLEQGELRAAEKLEAAIKEIGKNAPNKDLSPDQYLTEDCDECGNPLPEKRKQWGLRICVGCKAAQEKRQKFFR